MGRKKTIALTAALGLGALVAAFETPWNPGKTACYLGAEIETSLRTLNYYGAAKGYYTREKNALYAGWNRLGTGSNPSDGDVVGLMKRLGPEIRIEMANQNRSDAFVHWVGNSLGEIGSCYTHRLRR